VRRVALALPIRKNYRRRGRYSNSLRILSTAPNCRCGCTETTSSKSHLVWTDMIFAAEPTRFLAFWCRWQTASRATGGLNGLRFAAVRCDEPRTEFEQKKQENSLAGAARHLPRLGRTGRWRRFRYQFLPLRQLGRIVYSPCELVGN